jgi:hypothetical protein
MLSLGISISMLISNDMSSGRFVAVKPQRYNREPITNNHYYYCCCCTYTNNLSKKFCAQDLVIKSYIKSIATFD